MPFAVQYLAHKNLPVESNFARSIRRASRGQVWINVGRPVSRLAVAERVLKNFKTDHHDAIVRVRPIS